MKPYLFFFLLLVNALSAAQIKTSELLKLYNERNYAKLFDRSFELRKQVFGKNPVPDYFIAKALCGVGDYPNASRAFDMILAEKLYNLNEKQYEWIVQEKSKCALQASEETNQWNSQFLALLTTNNNAGFSQGKMGYVLDCSTFMEGMQFDNAFGKVNYEKRLFYLNEREKGRKYYDSLLGKEYNIGVSDRFIIIRPKQSNGAQEDYTQVIETLNKVYDFLLRQYKLRAPDKLITVYLLGSKWALYETARKTHGLYLPSSNIGYSYLPDLSILGNSDLEHIGTIVHELFHILIRTDVGDIPGWLDEGIACLYSQSYWKDETLYGQRNPWRTNVLRDYLNKERKSLPKLSSIIENNWSEFNIIKNRRACEIAANYAVVNHFAIWLQEKGLLDDMVFAFKNRKNVLTDITEKNQGTNELFITATGKSIIEVEKQFEQWMNANYQIDFTLNQVAASPETNYVFDTSDNMYLDEIHMQGAGISRVNDMARRLNTIGSELRKSPRYKRLVEAYFILKSSIESNYKNGADQYKIVDQSMMQQPVDNLSAPIRDADEWKERAEMFLKEANAYLSDPR